ncbi:MAG: PilZ domain-containing protein [Deltaproteobacteria bacterium]|nr:PilZ domain-containing protein [Deltaproteobacteria bacterium]
MSDSEPPPSSHSEKRSSGRIEVSWAVDCETDDTFLYASITNISDMGIFVRTETPLAVGTFLRLRFAPRDSKDEFVMMGRVQWVNPYKPDGENINPGMGIMFLGLGPDERERLVELVRTIAYLRDPAPLS